MTGALTWGLLATALAAIAVRRRSTAIVLVALQSVGLGVYALGNGHHSSRALAVAAAIFTVKAVALPALLLLTVRGAPKRRLLANESPALPRLIAALAAGLAIEQLIPSFGVTDPGIEHAAVGMLALGIGIAVVRRAVMFQALGFLIAENGIYLAGLSLPGGLPGFIELGLAFDLVVTLSVAAAFATKIHETLGSGDTSVLDALRD
ncbi:MAG TPA: hypothetical protein VN618_15790 [Solirubrobacteraceae bacterium]|nr:hypothetical protein [Solirubrobacteraceae bacterium]